jgi:protein-L-isoaspartate O-methyltransferase
LPSTHALPRFFQLHARARRVVGAAELRSAYDRVHNDYDDFWLSEAARPIDELIEKLSWHGDERVFEAGCGTGYATALLAERAGLVLAADLSRGMLAQARQRLRGKERPAVKLVAGDALALLARRGPFDLIFSSWVLGYIPLQPFFSAARRALSRRGRLAIVVHKENSPREPLELFAELVARNPGVLRKRVAFDFPRDLGHVRSELATAGLTPTELWEGAVVFRYDRPEQVLEHLLKSGAGTAFYDAIAPAQRASLSRMFVDLLAERHKSTASYEVQHDYVACIAQPTVTRGGRGGRAGCPARS